MKGEIVDFRLYDLGAEVDLAKVARLLDMPAGLAPLVVRSPTPPSVAFPEPREVVLPLDGVVGGRVEIRVHALGVLSVRLRIPFETASLAALTEDAAGRVPDPSRLASLSDGVLQRIKADIAHARVEPYIIEVAPERYTVYCLMMPEADVAHALEHQRHDLGRMVSGDRRAARVPERLTNALKHIVQSSPEDAVILGWDHALVLGHAGGYEDVLDVMELANLELLEFRTYDTYLDQRLDGAFRALDRLWAPGGWFRSARAALREISALRVAFARLTDNLHDTGKFFGDWYVAKLHQHMHERFHLASWERAVAAKMGTLEDMFHLAQEETNHRRSMMTEILIILLFVLDLIILLRV